MHLTHASRQSLVRAAVASVAVIALTACGGESSESEAKTSATSEASATPTSAAPTSEAPAAPASGGGLEAYVETMRPQAEEQMKRFDDVYKDFSVSAEGSNTLVYDYTFRKQVDPAQARTGIEGTRSALEGTAEPIAAEMKAAGVTDPHIRWVYRNADGSEILTIAVP